ncbi:MAG: hypothetical protein Q9218_003070 [Villophora microphyllina]
MKIQLVLCLTVAGQFLCPPIVLAFPSHTSSTRCSPDQSSALQDRPLVNSGAIDFALGTGIRKRVDVNIAVGGGWSLHYNTLELVSNVQPAIADLLRFYNGVLELGANSWANEAPLFDRTAAIGGVQLKFRSNRLISWEWIRVFLNSAIGQLHTQPGGGVIRGGYKVTFVGALTGAVVVAELVLPAWTGAAAAA